jgi:hypothetical protein
MNKIYLLLLLTPCSLFAQNNDVILPPGWADDPPELASLVTFARGESELRVAVVRYLEDKAAIGRRYEVRYSPVRIGRFTEFYLGWQKQLRELSFDDLAQEGRIDYIALRNRIDYDLETLRLEEERGQQISPLLPFSDNLRRLQEDRHDRKRVHPRTAAGTLNSVANEVSELKLYGDDPYVRYLTPNDVPALVKFYRDQAKRSHWKPDETRSTSDETTASLAYVIPGGKRIIVEMQHQKEGETIVFQRPAKPEEGGK